MNISYLICTHNETDTLKELLDIVIPVAKGEGDEVIISDDYSSNETTIKLLENASSYAKLVKYKLEDGYDDKKNKALKHCTGEYVIQLDGDECPVIDLLYNIKEIIEANSTTDLFWIARINNFVGVTNEHAKQWGWRLSPSTSIINEKLININSNEYNFLKINGYIVEEDANKAYLIDGKTVNTIKYKAVLVNAYDYQGRIFKNIPEIKWQGKLHERIIGNKNYVYIPDMNETLAIVHNKNILTQVETNIRYNKMFSADLNKGFCLPK